MYWAKKVALDLVKKFPDKEVYVLASGITPSGFMHMGSLREPICLYAVYLELISLGKSVRMVSVVDDMDPLTKLYHKVPDSFVKYLGRPMCDIPCPFNQSNSYAEYFLNYIRKYTQFKLKLPIDYILSSQLYASGLYFPYVDKILKNKETIYQGEFHFGERATSTLEEFQLYQIICESCKKINSTKVIDYKSPFINYICSCGYKGKKDISKGGGKLKFRVEYCIRWFLLDIVYEAAGKDISIKGGILSSALSFCKFFGHVPAHYEVFQFLKFEDMGRLSKTKLKSESLIDYGLDLFSLPFVYYLFFKTSLSKELIFPITKRVPHIYKEYESLEKIQFSSKGEPIPKSLALFYEIYKKTFNLSNRLTQAVLNITFDKLVSFTLVGFDLEQISNYLLKEEGLDFKKLSFQELNYISDKFFCVQNWVEYNSIPKYKLNQEKLEISHFAISFLREIEYMFRKCIWMREHIFFILNKCMNKYSLKKKELFSILYNILFSIDKGPKLDLLLSLNNKNKVLEVLNKYI